MSRLKDLKREAFCRLVAAGESATQAYITAGYSEKGAGQSASKLLKRTDIADRIAELRPQHEDRVLAEVEKVVEADLRRRADRVAVQCGICRKLMEVIRVRSEDPLHQSVPGGHTGLIAVHWKKQGKESKLEAEVDGVLLRELRATQEYIARELGEWRDQASVEHTIKSPADIPLNVLDMLEQQTRAELAAVIEQREYTYQPPAPAAHPALAEDGEHVSTPAAATDGSTSNPTHDSSKTSASRDEVIDLDDLSADPRS